MPFRILAIDGGGVRGIFPAHILAALSKQIGKLSGKFDLIAGTSTGAIIAAAVAIDFDLHQLCSLYESKAPEIFTRRLAARGVLRSQFSSTALKKLLSEAFGDRTFGTVKGRLLVAATDVSNGNVFVMKSSYLPSFVRDGDIRLRDGVLASCAAPTYFDPVRIKEYLLADGGLWGNNPSLIAYTEAVGKLGIPPADVRILSLGTGTGHRYYDPGATSGAWGYGTGWRGLQLFDTIFNIQSHSASNMAQLLLGERYLRISFDETGPLSMSDTNQVPHLRARAAEAVTYKTETIKQFVTT
jgi:patatin-like phospholipase/acyl hydrolase